jgi:hydrogenase maturation protease
VGLRELAQRRQRVRQPPILVLGMGNTLLMDDGVGPWMVEELRGRGDFPAGEVEFVDGGTLGLALLGRLVGRRAVVILDAVRLGGAPGTVHRLTQDQVLGSGSRSATAHEGNVGELLRTAMVLEELPPSVTLIGVEAKRLESGFGLSAPVRRALPRALEAALEAITAAGSLPARGRT